MNAKNKLSLACGAMMFVGSSLPVLAGPYPRHRLEIWRIDAFRELAEVEAAISESEGVVATQGALVRRLEVMVAAAPGNPETFARLKFEKRQFEVMYAHLTGLKGKRQQILDYIDWIDVQLAAWDEMESHGGG